MTIDEFRSVVRAEGIDERSFSLSGGLPSEQYVLDSEANGAFSVYYSERGLRSGQRIFPTESEALEHLARLLLSDPTTRSPRPSKSTERSIQTPDTIYHPDGKRRVRLIAIGDGRYTFVEEHYSDDPLEKCWIPQRRQFTTICESREAVEREARGRVDWLNEQNH